MDLIESISSQNLSSQVKFDMMQRALATCPKVYIGCGRKRIPSLLDSGSQVILIHQSYFKWEILPILYHIVGKRQKLISCFSWQQWKTPHVHVCWTRSWPLGDYCAKICGFYYLKAQWTIGWMPLNQIVWCHWLEFDKIGLSGVHSKIWIKDLGTFWLSNRCKSTATSTALSISPQ